MKHECCAPSEEKYLLEHMQRQTEFKTPFMWFDWRL